MKQLFVAALFLALSGCVLVGPGAGPGKDVVVCHKGKKTMTLPSEAAAAHINHGDRYGPC